MCLIVKYPQHGYRAKINDEQFSSQLLIHNKNFIDCTIILRIVIVDSILMKKIRLYHHLYNPQYLSCLTIYFWVVFKHPEFFL